MINGFYPKLSGNIDAEAEKLDVSSISSKTAEMHRLFDNARDSLLALHVFAKKVEVMLDDDQLLLIALNSLLPDGYGKRFVKVWWNGDITSIDIDNLDATNAARLALASQFGVSEQTIIRFEKLKGGANGLGAGIHVPCNHPGCSMSKSIWFKTPVEMNEAEQRASTEIWYCHHHREVAFSDEGALSDELLPVLQRISRSPGLTQTATGAKRDEIAFLEAAGLIRVDQITHGNRLLCYQIFITETGQGILVKSGVTNP